MSMRSGKLSRQFSQQLLAATIGLCLPTLPKYRKHLVTTFGQGMAGKRKNFTDQLKEGATA
jgi:hypothetical protein